MRAKIIGTGMCVPEQIVTNTDLMQFLDTDDAWITERTGIRERRISKEEGTVALATSAAQRAIEVAGIDPEEIDLVIVATSSPDQNFPSTATQVQAAVGANHATAFDLTAACAGFIYGLHITRGFFESGIYKTALVIGAETLSKVLDWNDRSCSILFGDGAGAAVLRASETGILSTITGSDGRKGDVLSCTSRTLGNCLTGTVPTMGFMQMNGQEVFKFAVKKIPEIVNQLLEECQMDREEIDHYILHQANLRILESASKRLKVPMEKIPVNLDKYGNTSAASVPILLDEMRRDGRLKAGDKVVLAGFGAGLTWGGALLEF